MFAHTFVSAAGLLPNLLPDDVNLLHDGVLVHGQEFILSQARLNV